MPGNLRRLRPYLPFIGSAIAAVLIAVLFSAKRAERPPQTPRRFSGSSVVLRMPSQLASARLPGAITVDVVRDPNAALFYDRVSQLDSIVAVWRSYLTATGASVRVVSPAQLRASRARVIVVPSSPCLSIETREAIEHAGARGQGLVLTGALGTHDAGCRALGYGTLIGVTGASRAEVLRDRSMVYVTVPADGPLAVDVPPGARLSVAPAAQIALRVPSRDAYYSAYTLHALPANDEPYLDAAIVHSNYHGARVVYLGFELRDVVRGPWEAGILRLLVRNAVAWTGEVPLASVASWPGSHRSAAVIAQDVESRFEAARFALDSLRAIGVRSSFFVLSDLAARNRRLVRRMLESGEVGTHSARHELFGGMPLPRQIERLSQTRASLERIIGGDVRGLRPPEEQFDEATMSAWAGADGEYLYGANDARCAAPELLLVNHRRDTLTLVPRVFADDFTAIGRPLRPPSMVRETLERDMETARAVKGLYVLSYHSQLLSRREYVPVLASVARQLAADSSVWIATAGDVAQWWLARSRLLARVTRVASDALDVEVHNFAPTEARDVTVLVQLPKGHTVVGDATPASERDGVARIRLSRLPPRQITRMRLRLAAD